MTPQLCLLLAPLALLGCGGSQPASSGAAGGTAGAAGAAAAGAPAGGAGGSESGGGGGAAGSPALNGGVGSSGELAGSAGQAGASGAAGAAGSSACAGVFCEDFELGMLDPAKWDLTTGEGGTALVQQELAAHGKYALKVHGLASAKDDYALITSKNPPAELEGAHFGRARFYITPKPLTSGHTQMVFAGHDGAGSANGPGPFSKLRYLEVSNINAGWQFGFDLLDVAPLDEKVYYPAGSPQVPTMKWSCLEWQFTDQPDTVTVWVDGAALGTFDDRHVSYPNDHVPGDPLHDGTSSGLIGTFKVFGFGFHDWHPHDPFDLYYDDIVLDTKRVGCEP